MMVIEDVRKKGMEKNEKNFDSISSHYRLIHCL